jgi:hypothetical protein
MARKKKASSISPEEEIAIEEFMKGIKIIAMFFKGEKDEIPSITDWGSDASICLLNKIHGTLGSEATEELIQVLRDSDDVDFRSPQ